VICVGWVGCVIIAVITQLGWGDAIWSGGLLVRDGTILLLVILCVTTLTFQASRCWRGHVIELWPRDRSQALRRS
jgi:hypothetical protein